MKNRSGRSGQKFGSFFGKTSQRANLHRALRGESLEDRHMMAGDVYLPFHNDLIPEDTNQDYSVTALDALMVINAINAGQQGELSGPGVGKADGPMLDVSGDNSLSALDALKVINRINGEGEEVADIVGFTLKLTDKDGNDLPSNRVSVGQPFLLKAYVQDLRGFDAKGVFAAYMDVNYDNSSNFQVLVGETQSFRYFYDKISTTDTSSVFKFTFGNETTAPIPLFSGNSPRSADQMAAAIQSALEALPSIGQGNVTVRRDPVASNQDSTNNIKRNSFDIQFTNGKAGQDVPLLVFDPSGVKMQTGQTLQYTLTDKYPADPTNPDSFASAFQFSPEYSSGRTATRADAQFDEVGAFAQSTLPDATGLHLLFSVPLKAVSNGTVTFTATPADASPAHDTLVFPQDTVPPNLIDYGNAVTVTIANNIIANADNATVAEDSASTQINVTSNDQLLSGSTFTITSVGDSTAGVKPTISSDGKKVNYQPKANFFGQDTFTYTITSNLGDTSTGTVTVTVTQVNDPISVPNQTATTNLGKPVQLTTAQLTAGGSVGVGEENIQQLSIASVVSPSTKGGTVSLSNGTVTYTPAVGFVGTDTFVVVATDNGLTNGAADPKTQSVTVTVTVTNDPPVAADDLTQTVDEESTGNTLNVLANDTAGANDVNDSLKITAVTAAQNGTVTISSDKKSLIYTPASGFVGSDTFVYTVTDLGGATDTATVVVDVQATQVPRARNDSANTTEDDTTGVLINVLSNDRTHEGSVAVLVSAGSAANGTVTIEDNGTPNDKSDDKIRYVPNANFSGQDTFTYVMNENPEVADPLGPSTGTVTVTVAAVNDAPVVVGDTATTTEDTAVTISSTTLLSNDSPGAGEDSQQTLTITNVQAVTTGAGSVALNGGNVVYTPAANFNGSFVFTYTATDNGSPALSGTATVTVTVGAVNDKPVAQNDTQSAVEDTVKTIAAADLLANDKPGPESATDELASQTLTIVAVGSSAQGGVVALANGGGSITYTPAANFYGTDTFTYTVRDNGNPALETTATVTVTVGAVNDAPVAGNDTVTAFKGAALTIAASTLLANDQPGPANESSQTLKITSVTGATNGEVTLLANGDVVFTPAAGYTGPASFSYTVSDNGQTGGADDFKTATANVSVDVKDFIPSRIAGTVWVDETHDGIINAAERRLGAVAVKLTGTSFGLPVSKTTLTSADGTYDFGQLAPGSYTISYATPALLTDGLDVAGKLGDNDGKANNNSFSFNITGIGGADASDYNFAVNGVNGTYGTTLEQLASRYYASGSQYANYGMYATLNPDGSQSSFFSLEGFKDIVFAEATMSDSGREVILTIVEADHSVHTAVLGRGKFIALHDSAGNTIIRILGGRDQLQFQEVDMSAPTISSLSTQPKNYLDAVDQFFDQEGF